MTEKIYNAYNFIIHIHTHTYINTYIYTHTHTHTYTYIYIYIYIYMCVCVCVCVNVCVYVCVCMYMYYKIICFIYFFRHPFFVCLYRFSTRCILTICNLIPNFLFGHMVTDFVTRLMRPKYLLKKSHSYMYVYIYIHTYSCVIFLRRYFGLIRRVTKSVTICPPPLPPPNASKPGIGRKSLKISTI